VGGALSGGETEAGTETALVEVVGEGTAVVGPAFTVEVCVVETMEVGTFVTGGVVGEPRGVVRLVVIPVGGSKPWTALVDAVAVVDAVDEQPATIPITTTAAPAATQ
jgi:hypothetical protein